MRKFLSFFKIFIFFPILCSSQSNDNWAYYENINNAEICIVENNLDSAIYYYESAFTASSFSFGKDLFNSALCAQELGDFILVKKYLIKIVEKGGGDFILGNSDFSKFHESNEYEAFLKGYLSANKIFYDSYDFRLRSYAELLLELDQFYKRTRDSEKWSKEVEVKIDKEAFLILMDFIKKDSLPNEQLIGIKIDKEQDEISTFYLTVLFRHAYQYGNWGLRPYMKRLIKNGSISPNVAIFHLDLDENEKPFCSEPVWKINGEYYVSEFKPEYLEKCNENRRKYHADSVEEYIKKIFFNLKNPYSSFILANSGGIAVFNNIPDEIVADITKGMKKINLNDIDNGRG